MGSDLALSETGAIRETPRSPGKRRTHSRLAAFPLRIAWEASHRTHHGAAQTKGLVTNLLRKGEKPMRSRSGAAQYGSCRMIGTQGERMSRPAGTYAIFETSQGNIVVRLFEKETPKTGSNFVGLAEGTKDITNEKTRQKERRPFYDGLIFHRVIPQFMIQGGCPNGTGMGGPGYKFADEFHASLKHSKAGMLSMANSGPGTNGSQFFITVAATPWLDNRHSIFGVVVEGQDVAKKISNVPRDSSDRPRIPVTINKLRIERVA